MSKKSFFNPRLYSERRRVTSNIKSGEIIIIPFAGVGPFVLPAAGKGAKVYALEINPDACAWLRENIRINRFEGQVIVIQDDFENLFRTGEIFQILDSKTHKESQNGESGGNCKKSNTWRKKSKTVKKPEIRIFLACPPVQVQAKERIKSFRFRAAGLIEP
ncbi:class I SAM-dependent methyltransferase family protein [Methanosarcina barkeri]|uniref:hypothetical protein n=1 Tax=Methanosarcina barkeri TaxID=2208 RepID=UPI0006D005BE